MTKEQRVLEQTKNYLKGDIRKLKEIQETEYFENAPEVARVKLLTEKECFEQLLHNISVWEK